MCIFDHGFAGSEHRIACQDYSGCGRLARNLSGLRYYYNVGLLNSLFDKIRY